MKNDLVKQGERLDDLQNGFFVIQDPEKFCFGMDAVLLANFASGYIKRNSFVFPKSRKYRKVMRSTSTTGNIPILKMRTGNPVPTM